MTADENFPTIRIMDGATVVAVFERVIAEGRRPRWSQQHWTSRAAQRYMRRRMDELRGLPYEQRAAIHRRDDKAHGFKSHMVQMVGDALFVDVYRPEWNGLRLSEIPGYREVYAFGKLTLRAEKLHELLDGVHTAGLQEVQIDTLRKLA